MPGLKEDDSDYLQLSGLQHFAFCKRQWALIHIEQQWQDNLRTVEGELLHERAHDECARDRSSNCLTVRSLRVTSEQLGISGCCDVVEFYRSDTGAKLAGEEGLWQPYPVEYKRGIKKADDVDRLQLCAQAMCLEEMLCCEVPEGALFYGEIRRRERVCFDDGLRAEVRRLLNEMHDYYRRGYTPQVKPGKHCSACSLKELCLPALSRTVSVKMYIKRHLEEPE